MPDIKLIRVGSDSSVVYVIDGHDSAAKICEKLNADVSVASVSVADWNRELSPWPAERCFRDGDDFGGGAGEYIAALAAEIPAFEAENGLTPGFRGIAGYSLAGLCALFALLETDIFTGAASVSGSMWFDGWLDYVKAHAADKHSACVYLSVGDREARTRNPRLSQVEESTRSVCGMLKSAGARAIFELNPGNHFNDPAGRLARGIDRLMEMTNN